MLRELFFIVFSFHWSYFSRPSTLIYKLLILSMNQRFHFWHITIFVSSCEWGKEKKRKLIKLLLLMNSCLNETNNWIKLLLLSICFPFQINMPQNWTKVDNFSDDFSSKFYFRLHEARKGVTDVKRAYVINFQIIISPLRQVLFFSFLLRPFSHLNCLSWHHSYFGSPPHFHYIDFFRSCTRTHKNETYKLSLQ